MERRKIGAGEEWGVGVHVMINVCWWRGVLMEKVRWEHGLVGSRGVTTQVS